MTPLHGNPAKIREYAGFLRQFATKLEATHTGVLQTSLMIGNANKGSAFDQAREKLDKSVVDRQLPSHLRSIAALMERDADSLQAAQALANTPGLQSATGLQSTSGLRTLN